MQILKHSDLIAKARRLWARVALIYYELAENAVLATYRREM